MEKKPSVEEQLAQWRAQQQQATACVPPLPPGAITATAGFGIRLLARLLDTAFGLLLGIAAGCIFGVIMGVLQAAGAVRADWVRQLGGMSVGGFLFSLSGSLLYHTATEGLYGASVGKLACRLRVVSADGAPCTLVQALQRSVAYLWDSLFFGLVAYSRMDKTPLNQRYGDAWARTVVVRTDALPPAAARSTGMLFVALFTGAALLLLGAAAGLLLKIV
jgi:uncharacterized RDD family membrane protein YckC